MASSAWPVAEQSTLVAAIHDPGFRALVLDAGQSVLLHPESQRVWDILRQLTDAGHPIDTAAVEVALGHPITAPPSQDYWPVLLEQRLQRQLTQLGHWLLKPRDHVSPTALAARALQSLNQALAHTQQGALLSGAAAAQAGLERLAAGSPRWLASGVPVWDAATAEWGPGDFLIVGARPSQGKTALGLQMTWRTAQTGRGVAFASLEMGAEAIGLRAVCQVTQWPLDVLQVRLLDPRVEQAVAQLASWPWHVLDASGASLADLQAAVARADMTGPRCDVVIVDYLQIIRPALRQPSREQEISRLATELKQWARRDGRLIIALSQLSRKVEERLDRRPTLADLRESGAIEQVADGVVLIYHTPDSTDAELIVAKNRNGPTGVVPVHWEAETMRFGTR